MKPGLGDLISAARRVHAAVDLIDHEMCKALLLNRTDLRALNRLEEGPKTAKLLGEELGLTSGSVTALIDRLEARDLVKREKIGPDRRSVSVVMQADAHERLGGLYRSCAEALDRAFTAEFGADGLSDAAHTIALLGDGFEAGLAHIRTAIDSDG
ncbi:MAG: MarR family transcriptional regulator [Litorimonas sp.]